MRVDYLGEVFRRLGPGERRFADDTAWVRLESEISRRLPDDYKSFIDEYAPIQVNGHLFFGHPATEMWNLYQEMQESEKTYRETDWSSLPSPVLGSPGGLIPVFSSDHGCHVFLAEPSPGEWRVVVDSHDGNYEYSMGFSEWLYRYLIGEEMYGPGNSDFYPGPVQLETLPMVLGERTVLYHGPDRGM